MTFTDTWKIGDKGHLKAHNDMAGYLNALIGIKTVVASNDAPIETKRIADVVCDGVEDNVDFQSAIDAGNDVYLLPGNYSIVDTVTVKPNVFFEMAQRSRVSIDADVDGFFVKQRARMAGGNLLANAVHTKSCVLFDGAELYFGLGPICALQNMNIVCARGSGYGVRFVSDEEVGASYAAALMFNNLHIQYGLYGIFIDIPTIGSTGTNYFNSNMFTDIWLLYNRYGIYANITGSFTANTFQNIHYQADVDSVRMMLINGPFNQFTNIVGWDWMVSEPLIEFGPNGNRNLIVGWLDKKYTLDRAKMPNTQIVHDISMQDTSLEYNNGRITTTWPPL